MQPLLLPSEESQSSVIQPGRPIRPEETTLLDLASAWEAMGPCFAGPKIDGYRLQLHRTNQKVWLFSRNLKDWTSKYRDIVASLQTDISDHQAVFDSEMVAIAPSTGKILPRKMAGSNWPHHRVILFDLLYLDGQSYLPQPFEVRLQTLRQVFSSLNPRVLVLADELFIETFDELKNFYGHCIQEGFEGLVLKSPSSAYRPGTNSLRRVKVKESDTVDAVILGYDQLREGTKIIGAKSFLIGIYNKEKSNFVAIAKATKGKLSSKEWQKLYLMASNLAIAERLGNVLSRMQPDVWVVPRFVVETEGYGRRPSQKYSVGFESDIGGFEFSEARFSARGIRDDKDPEDATTLAQFMKIRLASGYEDDKQDTDPTSISQSRLF